MARRQPSIKTIRENVSHLRKMISRVEAMGFSAPKPGIGVPEVKRFGSRLIIDGKTYTPKDLDKLVGSRPEWGLHVLDDLEKKLAREQHRLVQAGGKPKKTETLSNIEVKQAKAGKEYFDDEKVTEFIDEWLEVGSPSWKKNLFYHTHGFDQVNRGTVRAFYDIYGVNNVEELIEVLGV